MKKLILDQHEIGIRTESDGEITFERTAARGVLQDKTGRIAVMYFTVDNFYKLPGGGVDEGEDIEAGFRREIREETGYEIDAVKPLCVIEEFRYFNGMHQLSHCFGAVVGAFIGTELTEKERSQGMTLRWADSIDEAIDWIESAQGKPIHEDTTGLAMMKKRDVMILEQAKEQL